MRYFYLVLGAIIVSSCSHGLGSLPMSSSPQYGYAGPLTGVQPKIKKVSAITATQYQTIIISGSGLGTTKPYDGDSAYLQIWDKTGHWSAGLKNGSQTDSVWLDVKSWRNNKITISGFTGDYGQSYWVLHKGDKLEINVWNPQDGNGPSTKYEKVK